MYLEKPYLEKPLPDEQYLSDPERTRWILCEEERMVADHA